METKQNKMNDEGHTAVQFQGCDEHPPLRK